MGRMSDYSISLEEEKMAEDDFAYEEYVFLNDWEVEGKCSYQIFDEIMDNSLKILDLNIKEPTVEDLYINPSLYVMVYGHVVAGIEGYLSSTFIQNVFPDEGANLLKKILMNDKNLAKKSFSVDELFDKKIVEDYVKKYLRNLIFHKIDIVKPMYKDILNIDLGSKLEWLFKAVIIRHDCVHRAGYTKDGNTLNLSKEDVESLIDKCNILVMDIEQKLKSNKT